MALHPNHLAILNEVAGSRTDDIYAAFEEIKEHALAAIDELNNQATRAGLLSERLAAVLTPEAYEEAVGDALDEPDYWLTDKGEIQRHLTTLSDALDNLDGAA